MMLTTNPFLVILSAIIVLLIIIGFNVLINCWMGKKR
jgi:hypothetical protein